MNVSHWFGSSLFFTQSVWQLPPLHLKCCFLCEWAQKATKNKHWDITRKSDTERKAVFASSRWAPRRWVRAVKGHIVDVKTCQHQRADSGCERRLAHSLSLTPCSHTGAHTHAVPLSPLKTPKNIKVYCSSSQPKNNIWKGCVNSERGQGAHSNMIQCVSGR